ncbi:MAG: leucine-rich repeat protein [Clostridia bacterium]|nr:leucine-rich repeat protein [Clostridia bacterium]
MKKTVGILIFAIIMSLFLMLASGAADLAAELEEKTSVEGAGGYCIDPSSNIRFDYYNEGTEDAPSYTLYFGIDESVASDNTVLTGANTANYASQAWYNANIAASDIHTVVIGDGITETNGFLFANMTGLETVEIPASYTKMNNGIFFGCINLHTVYVRGTEPSIGTFDLGNLTVLPVTNNLISGDLAFRNCEAVKKYIFNDSLVVIGGYRGFAYNTSLETFVCSSGWKKFGDQMFVGCTSLKSVTIGVGVTDYVTKRVFKNCTALETVTFLYGATKFYVNNSNNLTTIMNTYTKEDVIANNDQNTFANCPSLKRIIAPSGSAIATLSQKLGFSTLMDMKPDSATAVHSGHCIDPSGNIAFEVHSETDGNVLYFFIDENVESDNTVLTCAESSSHYAAGVPSHLWYTSDITAAMIKKVVIGDGITEITGALFHGMSILTTVELPESLTTFNSGYAFARCDKLTTVYTRGNVPVVGTFDFSEITILNPKAFFYNCQSVVQYIFGESSIASGTSLFYSFTNNAKLTSVVIPEGIKNLAGGGASFSGCKALKEITLPLTCTRIPSESFKDCKVLEKITLLGDAEIVYVAGSTEKSQVIASNKGNAFSNCPALTTVNAPIGTQGHTFAVTFGFETTHEIYGSSNEAVYCVFDPTSGRLTIENTKSGWSELVYSDANVKKILAAYKDDITSISVDKFSNIQAAGLFSGLTALEAIYFVENQMLGSASGDLFSNCEALQTVYFGLEGDAKPGVADFSGMNSESRAQATFTNGSFVNCEALKTLILPSIASTVAGDAFTGCTGLEYVIIPSGFTAIEAGAFADCTALSQVIIENPDVIIDSDTAFPDKADLGIVCFSDATAASISNLYENTKAANYASAVGADGFSIRMNRYNGLRGIFHFDKAANTAIENAGMSLLEYGILVCAASEYEFWGGVSAELVGAEIITNSALVKKLPVFSDGEIVGKTLDEDENNVSFAGTVINFTKGNCNRDVYMCSYAVYQDEQGRAYSAYAHYSDDYKFFNIYDLTLDMYRDGTNGINTENTDEAAVWDVILEGAVEGAKELAVSEGVTLTIVKDGEEYLAFVRTNEAGVLPTEADIESAKALIPEEYADAEIVLGGFNISEGDGLEGVVSEPKKLSSYVLAENKYYRSEGAQHLQGACVDDELKYIYFNLTAMILKVDLETGEEVGKFVAPNTLNALGFHMGDITYHDGKLYSPTICWNSSNCYITVIDADKIVGDVTDVDENGEYILNALYLPQINTSGSNLESVGAWYGIDGITVGTLPGKGYIKDGVEITDDKEYLMVCNASIEDNDGYDSNVKMISVFDFDDITSENLLPLTADRIKADTPDGAAADGSFEYKHRMFVYTGSNRYSVQNLEFDKDTGDIYFACYGRDTAGNLFPNLSTFVVDGGKKLYLDEVEMGQSVPATSANYEDALAKATLYRDFDDADGDGILDEQMTGWHMTLKCICGKGDIESHNNIAYGDTGYAVKLCGHYGIGGHNGLISIGSGRFYVTTQANDTTDASNTKYGACANLYRISNRVGELKFVKAN